MKELVNTNDQMNALPHCSLLQQEALWDRHRQYELPSYDLNTKC